MGAWCTIIYHNCASCPQAASFHCNCQLIFHTYLNHLQADSQSRTEAQLPDHSAVIVHVLCIVICFLFLQRAFCQKGSSTFLSSYTLTAIFYGIVTSVALNQMELFFLRYNVHTIITDLCTLYWELCELDYLYAF
jgi:hypothetical protein